MRSYATSKIRIILLGVMLATGVFVASGYAQDTPTGGAAAKPINTSLFSVIMSNTDPVFFTILLLSIIGLTLIIQGFIRNRAAVLIPDSVVEQIRDFINRRQFKELMEFTETDRSFISRALGPALKRAPIFSSMKEAMETAIGEQTAEQFRRIEYLNIIGNLGPLLGLLGTVLGMIEAFTAMNAAQGQASPAQLAGGISKALAHTFLGLMLAVPCLAAFGILRTIVDRLTVRGALIAEELLLMVKPREAPAAAVQRPGMATPQPAAYGNVAGSGFGSGAGSPATAVRKGPMPAPAPAPNVQY
ncbi:MAG TPA: MotA/TolQ/ExbB proton channel family protein [Humisphaera sp.]|jgi:biopolymer transport protein ExbB|nr:MotA/TolQ/ExbB proton channel family protein [Humisphaera sp.]